jgi:hypothetical protein
MWSLLAGFSIQEGETINYLRCRIYTTMLWRWFARKLMSIMGNLYVWLDKSVKYTDEEVSQVLGLDIDEDLRTSSRYELCRIVEEEFKVPKDSFWTLHSTQKIRFATQQIREMKKPSKFEMGY